MIVYVKDDITGGCVDSEKLVEILGSFSKPQGAVYLLMQLYSVTIPPS